MLAVTAISTLTLLGHVHSLNTSYQKHVQQVIQQLEKTKAQQRLESDKQLQELQQQNQAQQQRIEDLQKQVSIKKAQQAATAAAQTASSVQVASTGNCAAYAPLLAQYNWNVSTALAIMHAESGCRADALSPTCDRGLMQINCIHSDMVSGNLAALYTPATNIAVAYSIYTGRGWSAWSTYTSGAYLRYL